MEERVYEIIYDFYNSNGIEPSIREIMKIMNLNNHSNIYYYLKKLEKKGLLKHVYKRWILNRDICNRIKVINEDKYFNMDLSDKERFIFKINNNYFNEYMIKKNDYLIIEKHKMNNGDLGLFIINDEYRVMKYFYKEGFYILEDNSKEILARINCIGKVIGLIRI